MTAETTSPPTSIQEQFPEHTNAIAVRFTTNERFREICLDFDEVVTNLRRLEPTEKLASELKRLVVDLEEEILLELDSGAED